MEEPVVAKKESDGEQVESARPAKDGAAKTRDALVERNVVTEVRILVEHLATSVTSAVALFNVQAQVSAL